MSEPGDKLERAYRGLAREEPSSALDASILEASRRAVHRPSSSRWAMPVSIAAVLMLAVGVTMHMQQEEPGIETSPPRREPPPAPAPVEPVRTPEPQSAPSRAKEAKPQKAQPASPAPQPRRDKLEQRAIEPPKSLAPVEKPAADERTRQEPAAPPPAMQQAPLAFPAQQNAAPAAAAPPASSADFAPPPAAATTPAAPAAAAGAPAAARAKSIAAPIARPQAAEESMAAEPERELERIARLRAAGRNAEADRALEEFRKRYPDYHIADAMWERVRPR